ncbi:DNA translocase FtsK [Amycolatopsis thailandensis]|uniref:DNA translocase FtsK n=1 Tax=Amycolatopsis thailandensis TaxID=589330 RepID=UPI0037AE31D8
MSSIKVETSDLIDLLKLLQHTASSDRNDGVTAGVLLHTTRGERGAEPGKQDLLVGTSTDRFAVGHTNVVAYGQLARPSLWGIEDVKAVIATFKSKASKDKDGEGHQVHISIDLGHVTVSEDPNLFEDGVQLSFHEQAVDDFPRRLWHVLEHVGVDAYVSSEGGLVPVANRTDLGAARLAPFTKVASKLGVPVQLFRTHQNRYLLVQIGDHYRGAIAPIRWDLEESPSNGHEPSGDVHTPDLPPIPKRDTPPPPKTFTPSGVRESSGVITGFPALPRDTRELGKAADLVITSQYALPSLLTRGLRITAKRADGLLEDLFRLGIVGPYFGGRAREVLVAPEGLDDVLKVIAELKTEEPEDDQSDPYAAALAAEIEGTD